MESGCDKNLNWSQNIETKQEKVTEGLLLTPSVTFLHLVFASGAQPMSEANALAVAKQSPWPGVRYQEIAASLRSFRPCGSRKDGSFGQSVQAGLQGHTAHEAK